MQMICYLTTIPNYVPIHWIHNYRLKVSKGPMEGSQREVHEISLFDKAMNIKITCTSGMKLRNFDKLIE